jgi:hypothetical protein
MADSGWETYRRGWRTAVMILVGLGLVTAFVFVGLSTIVVAFLMGGTLVASVHLSVGLAQERKTAELVRDVLGWAGRAGLCVVAITGYATAVGIGTLWLIVLLAITSPPLVNWLWPRSKPERVRRPEPKPEPTQQPEPTAEWKPRERKPKERKVKERKQDKQQLPEPPPPEPVAPTPAEPPDLTALTDEDLCLAWRRSFTELQTCTTDEQRLAVIAARHAYLDELERRAPDSFTQWLESGPRAAGNPAKFFSPRTNHGGPE